jgi:hypothetical protein
MIAFGMAWFVTPEIKGLVAPSRAPKPIAAPPQAPIQGQAKPI